MINADEELSDLLKINNHERMITHRGNNAFLKVVAADNETVGGKKATGVLIDELWLFGKKPGAENMLREACGGLASRPEGFTIYLSTQSDEAPAGIFKQKLQYARGVRDGRIDDNSFLPIIYEFPEKMVKDKEYRNPKYFYVTNPNLGASVDPIFLDKKFKEAEEAGEDSMCGFLAKHLNIEIGLALKSQRWSAADFWEEATDEHITLEYILENSEVLVAGADGGGLDDMFGLAIIGRHHETHDWMLWNKAWIHPIALERRKSEAARYKDFAKDGDLIIVGEIGEDVQQIGEIIQRCEESGLLDRIGVDPVGIGDIVDEFVDRNIEQDRIVGISQGWKLSGAIKTAERKIAEKTMMHGGMALMAWCVGNARVEPRSNAILITKGASGTGKIDPLMATFNAVALMAMNPEARGNSNFYDHCDLLTSGG
jgi:phage terminase large subunit-like protein